MNRSEYLVCNIIVIYENDPVGGGGKGHDFVRKFLGSLMSADRVEWEVLRQTTSETCVMNERVDRFWNNGDPTPTEIPLMGVFDVDKNGLITRWQHKKKQQMNVHQNYKKCNHYI